MKNIRFFAQLPDEILFEILCFVNPNFSLNTISFVSKRLNKLCNSELLWKKYTILKNQGNITRATDKYEETESWKKGYYMTKNPYLKDRYAYVTPSVVEKFMRGEENMTQFHGQPFVPEGKDYPNCVHCGKSVISSQTFFQLHSDDFSSFEELDIPWLSKEQKKVRDDTYWETPHSLYQWFRCECGKATANIITGDDLEKKINKSIVTREEHARGRSHCDPAHQSFGFDGKLDQPKLVDYEGWAFWELGRTDEFLKKKFKETIFDEEKEKETKSDWQLELPLGGDKLMGKPNWIQGDETPKCEDGETDMILLYQMDSTSGHISMCDGAMFIFIDPKDPLKTSYVYQC